VAESRADYRRTLAKVAIFSGLTDAELDFLAERAVPRQFAPGEMVFGEGEPCAGLYVVERGNIRIFKSSAAGREQVLSIDGPGSSVAEVPVFDGGNYPASGAAVDRATLLFVGKQDFRLSVWRTPKSPSRCFGWSARACGGWWGLSKSFRSPPCAIVWRPFCYILLSAKQRPRRRALSSRCWH